MEKNKIKVFILEDEIIHLEALKITLEECGLELAGECNNTDCAFEMIKKTNPDVVLADISLPGMQNGITLSAKVHEELGIPHIFTTSYTREEIIDQAIKTNPAGYLRKPIDAVNLTAAIKLALNGKETKEEKETQVNKNTVFTKIGNKLVRINIDDIIIVKSNGGNFISLITEKKEILCRSTLKEFSDNLPKNFIKTHRSYYINVKFLDAFNEQDQTAILKDKEVPVARSYKKEFLDSFLRI